MAIVKKKYVDIIYISTFFYHTIIVTSYLSQTININCKCYSIH